MRDNGDYKRVIPVARPDGQRGPRRSTLAMGYDHRQHPETKRPKLTVLLTLEDERHVMVA